MRKFVVLVMIPLLAACGLVQQQKMAEAHKMLLAEVEQCKSQYEEHILKTYTARANCINAVMLKIADYGFPYMDLVNLSNAYRTALAKKVDTKKMSAEDAEVEQAELGTRIMSEMQRRDALTSSTAAQRQQANAATTQSMGVLLQGLGTWQQANQPQKSSIVCSTASGSTVCQ